MTLSSFLPRLRVCGDVRTCAMRCLCSRLKAGVQIDINGQEVELDGSDAEDGRVRHDEKLIEVRAHCTSLHIYLSARASCIMSCESRIAKTQQAPARRFDY